MSYSIQIKCFVLFTEQGNSICLVAVRSGFRCRTSEEFENFLLEAFFIEREYRTSIQCYKVRDNG